MFLALITGGCWAVVDSIRLILQEFLSFAFGARKLAPYRQFKGGLSTDREIPHENEVELYHNTISICSGMTRVCLEELKIDYKSHHVDLIETGAYQNLTEWYTKIHPSRIVPLLVYKGNPVYESIEQIKFVTTQLDPSFSLYPEGDLMRDKLDRMMSLSEFSGTAEFDGADSAATAANCVKYMSPALFFVMMSCAPLSECLMAFLYHFDPLRVTMFTLPKLIHLIPLEGVRKFFIWLLCRFPTHYRLRKIARAEMRMHLQELAKALNQSNGPYIFGYKFSMADITWGVILDRVRLCASGDLIKENEVVLEYFENIRQRECFKKGLDHWFSVERPIVADSAKILNDWAENDPWFRSVLHT